MIKIVENQTTDLIPYENNAKNADLRDLYPTAIINPIGEWTGGTDVERARRIENSVRIWLTA